ARLETTPARARSGCAGPSGADAKVRPTAGLPVPSSARSPVPERFSRGCRRLVRVQGGASGPRPCGLCLRRGHAGTDRTPGITGRS
ncbi:hypothetical protein SB717_37370, partial [Priestia sp. SIMBA_032]|uniref:hypothetical protein n=1 Tax=Priestia sp. SIMBA_032 TaxID=3085775 RepID=UPI0039791AF8